ncbi:MAG: hypothetical protein QXU20_03345 [Candidatus Woesearchaeota archaeon]
MKLERLPKRRISDIEKEAIFLRAELSKLRRERADMILNKGILLYFSFLIVAIVGLLNHYITLKQLNVLVGLALAVLIITMWPYITTTSKEERELEELIEELYV